MAKYFKVIGKEFFNQNIFFHTLAINLNYDYYLLFIRRDLCLDVR